MKRRRSSGPMEFRNAERARFGAGAIAHFAQATDQMPDLREDPDTVLTDLLADLMHWCKARRVRSGQRSPRFLEALRWARRHFVEETRASRPS